MGSQPVAPRSSCSTIAPHCSWIVALCVWAVFDPRTRAVASVAVAISTVSFLALFLAAGSPPPLKTIALADLFGLPALAYVAWAAFAIR